MTDVFIGLEIHIQLLTRSKVFCSCPSGFGEEPNLHVCPVCLGYPGVLPALNRRALEFAYLTGLALKCTMAKRIHFDRKNYFYPDMAKNYQISQFHAPVGVHGNMDFDAEDGRKTIRIHDIHLEEDAGKMIHGSGKSLLDYNRAGSSLLEIVTEPDFRSGREAELFLQEFRSLVRTVGVCDGNMEEGSLRCDANVSVNKPGKGLGTKVEIKNLNSSRFVRKALEYEIRRQSRLLRTGRAIIQETRLWDEKRTRTEPMRSKEEALDYRYFPEPDLPPFCPDEQFITKVADMLTELPISRYDRYRETWELNEETARYLAEDVSRAEFFEQSVEQGADAKLAASWIKGELTKLQAKGEFSFSRRTVDPQGFSSLLRLTDAGEITAQQAKEVLQVMAETGGDPQTIIKERVITGGLDEQQLRDLASAVISQYPDTSAQIQGGNMKALGFLMGSIMKETGGAADPKASRRILLELLGIDLTK